VSTYPEKTQVMCNWPVPTNTTKLRGFLGWPGTIENLFVVMASFPNLWHNCSAKKGLNGQTRQLHLFRFSKMLWLAHLY
jgi:hypothetical protein